MRTGLGGSRFGSRFRQQTQRRGTHALMLLHSHSGKCAQVAGRYWHIQMTVYSQPTSNVILFALPSFQRRYQNVRDYIGPGTVNCAQELWARHAARDVRVCLLPIHGSQQVCELEARQPQTWRDCKALHEGGIKVLHDKELSSCVSFRAELAAHSCWSHLRFSPRGRRRQPRTECSQPGTKKIRFTYVRFFFLGKAPWSCGLPPSNGAASASPSSPSDAGSSGSASGNSASGNIPRLVGEQHAWQQLLVDACAQPWRVTESENKAKCSQRFEP